MEEIIKTTKVCFTCKIEKPVEEFVKDKNKHDGLCSQCKECRKKYCYTKEGRWSRIVRRANLLFKRRGIISTLTEEEYYQHFWSNRICKICGDEITTPGLDRINSNKGYSIKNCVSCCSTCNRMKGDMTPREFIVKIQKICKNIVINPLFFKRFLNPDEN